MVLEITEPPPATFRDLAVPIFFYIATQRTYFGHDSVPGCYAVGPCCCVVGECARGRGTDYDLVTNPNPTRTSMRTTASVDKVTMRGT